MKKIILKLLMFLLCVGMLLGISACGKTEKSSPETSGNPTRSTEETTENALLRMSDQELIEATVCSQGMLHWGTLSSVIPRSAEGIKVLADSCPEFKELLLRDSGLYSLKEYAPKLIEEYKENDQYRLNALYMEDLLDYMFPYLKNQAEVEIE